MKRITMLVVCVSVIVSACATPVTTAPTATTIPATPTFDPPLIDVAATKNELAGFFKKIADFTFSGAVLVEYRGEIILSEGYGFADAKNKIPNTAQTKYRIASLTKQFTAAAILILQQEGKLNV